MNARKPSWRRVAIALGERMRHHALCDAHPASDPDKDCPFCEDRTAYDLYVARLAADGMERRRD